MPTLFRRFLSRLKSRNVGDGNGTTFFVRYRLLKTPFGGVYLHEFLRGDLDRCLHDHPWGFLSIVLKDGYWEEMREYSHIHYVHNYSYFEPAPTVKHWRRPGSILYRPALTAHRIELEPGTKPWSLVFFGPTVRPWGFYTLHGWRPWKRGEPSPICETE